MLVKCYQIHLNLIRRKSRRVTIYSVRYDKKGNFTNGQPCSHCVKYLISIGIRHTVYSTQKGDLTYSLLEDLQCHYSSGNR